MRSDTRTATITAAPKDVVAFVGNPANLPRWAIGFARDVRRDDGRWIVSTGQGEIPVSIDVNEDAGTVDFRMAAGPNREAVAYSRVVPNEEGCEYTFTQFQAPGVSDEQFEQLVGAVTHELAALKALMEITCPL